MRAEGTGMAWRAQIGAAARRLVGADPALAEAFAAVLAGVIGAWLLLPLDTFRSNPSFREMGHLAPEWAWGLAFLVAGLTRLCAVGGGSLRGRSAAALAHAGLWAFFALMFWLTSPVGLAVPTFGLVAVQTAWVYYRLRWEGERDAVA